MSSRAGKPGTTSPKHAARPLASAYWAMGALCLPLAALAFLGGSVAIAVIALGLGACSMSMARSLGTRIEAVQLTNTAVQHLTRGNVAEAEALLAAIPARSAGRGIVGRAVATLRAIIALYEGRLEESVRYATAAVEGRLGLLTRTFEAGQVAAAHAIRALAYAALGDSAKAKADTDAAESSALATPEVLARARVVRALLASRSAYHEEAFRVYLVANAQLVLEHAMPRERALFRALRRMSRSPQRRSVGAYREPGRSDDQAPSKMASWVAYVAPEAAPYVDGDRSRADQVDELPIPSGVPSDVRALVRARAGASSTRPGRRRGRTIAIGCALVAMFVAVWQFFTPAGTTASGGQPASVVDSALAALLPVVMIGVGFVVFTSLDRRRHRTLALALRQAATGHRERAKPVLERLAAGNDAIIAATAGLELARLAASESSFAEAISRCDAAIARVHAQPLRAVASDLLLPGLMTESAVATAARGGLEEADAELAVLCRDFPTYSRLASAQLRVRLVRAVRAGDRAAACALARARTAELPLPYREDILADLLLAARGESTEEDLERLDAELEDDAGLRKWIDAVAPGLRDDGPVKQTRIRVAAREPARAARDAAEAECGHVAAAGERSVHRG